MFRSLSKAARIGAALVLLSMGAAHAQEALALINAKVDFGDGRVLEGATILIEAGKIKRVGTNLALPIGAKGVDCAGLTVYPGFIDAYASRGLKPPATPEGKTPPATREVAPATMWAENRRGVRAEVQAAKYLDLASQLADWHKQGFTSALIAPGSGLLRGTACFVNLRPGDAAGAIVKPDIAFELSYGGAQGTGYPGSLMGSIAHLRQMLYDAQRYGEARAIDPASTPADPAFENMQPMLQGKVPALFSVATDREIGRALMHSREFGLKPLLYRGSEAYKRADELAKGGIGVIMPVDVADPPSLEPSGPDDTTPGEVRQERHANWRERSTNVFVLVKTGVTIALSTEGDTVESFLKNLRRQIELGLPREAALTALTSGAAKVLGLPEGYGTIREGGVANLTIMTGDFADAKSEVRMVLVNGQLIEIPKKTPEVASR